MNLYEKLATVRYQSNSVFIPPLLTANGLSTDYVFMNLENISLRAYKSGCVQAWCYGNPRFLPEKLINFHTIFNKSFIQAMYHEYVDVR